jgi:hypothetical protein
MKSAPRSTACHGSVAHDEGYFAEEKLAVEFIKPRGGRPKNGLAETSLVNPIVGHAPFAQGEVTLFRS